MATSAITPFLLASTGMAMVLLIRPGFAAINYAVAYVFFYHAVAWTQQNPEILLSNRVNGISVTAIGFGITLLLWRYHALISQQRRKIEAQNRELAEKKTRLENYLAVMSHEIRTLMNGIVGMNDLVLQTPLQSDQREYAQSTQEASKMLLALVNDILDYAKIEEGMLEMESVDFDLPSMVRGSVAMVEPKARQKGLVLRSSLDPVLPASLRSDPVRLRQVLLEGTLQAGDTVALTAFGGGLTAGAAVLTW